VDLLLRVVADVGLVGFPNAGWEQAPRPALLYHPDATLMQPHLDPSFMQPSCNVDAMSDATLCRLKDNESFVYGGSEFAAVTAVLCSLRSCSSMKGSFSIRQYSCIHLTIAQDCLSVKRAWLAACLLASGRSV